jgi:Uma2 family endonuclease
MDQYILEMPQEWTDEDLFTFCSANKGLHIERSADGRIVIMPPIGGETSNSHNIDLYARVRSSGTENKNWAKYLTPTEVSLCPTEPCAHRMSPGFPWKSGIA